MGLKFFVVRQGALGDVLLSTPILAGLKKSFPGSRTTLMVDPNAVDLVRGLPFVDDVFPYDDNEKPFFRMWRKMLGHDVSIHISLTYRPTVAAALAGIPVRIGIPHKRGMWLTRRVPWREDMDHTYEPFVTANILKEGGLDLQLSHGELSELHVAEAAEEEKAELATLLREGGIASGEPYLVSSPLTSSSLKDWELQKWDALFSRLHQVYGLRAILFGGATIPFSWTCGVVTDLSRRISLRQVGELVKNARLLVNSCSLPLHIAAAVHTPCVALYGPTDPARWAPRKECEVVCAGLSCSPCDGYHAADCNAPKCMRAISVEQVFDACTRMLS